MATTVKGARQTKTTNRQHANTKLQLRTNLFTFVAAFAGVAIGVVAALAMVTPMIRSEFASQSQKLSHQLLAAVPASATFTDCSLPSGGFGGGSGGSNVTTPAKTVTAPKPGGGSGGGSGAGGTTTVFVHKLVSGIWANDKATISNTGTDSTNKVSFTNTNTTTVDNDNNLSVTNNNPQFAGSGDAAVVHNTTGGAATSGDAKNNSSVDVTYTVTN